MPVGIKDHGVAHVVADLVTANDVHPHHKALVFQGTGFQQCLPHVTALLRPIGHIDNGIVVATVAGKDRETQVVAYLQQETYATPLDNHTPTAGDIFVRLTGIAEEMALIIIVIATVRTYEEETVIKDIL